MYQLERRFQKPLSTAVLLKTFVLEALQSIEGEQIPWNQNSVRLVKILELT